MSTAYVSSQQSSIAYINSDSLIRIVLSTILHSHPNRLVAPLKVRHKLTRQLASLAVLSDRCFALLTPAASVRPIDVSLHRSWGDTHSWQTKLESIVPSQGAHDSMHAAHQQAKSRCNVTPSRTGMKRNVFLMPGMLSYVWSGFGRMISAVGVYCRITSLMVLLRCVDVYSAVWKRA